MFSLSLLCYFSHIITINSVEDLTSSQSNFYADIKREYSVFVPTTSMPICVCKFMKLIKNMLVTTLSIFCLYCS